MGIPFKRPLLDNILPIVWSVKSRKNANKSHRFYKDFLPKIWKLLLKELSSYRTKFWVWLGPIQRHHIYDPNSWLEPILCTMDKIFVGPVVIFVILCTNFVLIFRFIGRTIPDIWSCWHDSNWFDILQATIHFTLIIIGSIARLSKFWPPLKVQMTPKNKYWNWFDILQAIASLQVTTIGSRVR